MNVKTLNINKLFAYFLDSDWKEGSILVLQ